MYIIAGLGNPGRRYENTRHNIGFITVDYLAGKYDIKVKKLKHEALVGEGQISGHKVLLVKPQTYMNLSGQCLRQIMDFYKIDLQNLLVIYDDVDLELGSVRIRKQGGAGTHNGMRSILYDLQSEQFPRIRIGMGSAQSMELRDFVTGGFTKEEKPLLENAVIQAAAAIQCILEEGLDKAMNLYNTRIKAEDKQEEID